jgi:hypothetical protein
MTGGHRATPTPLDFQWSPGRGRFEPDGRLRNPPGLGDLHGDPESYGWLVRPHAHRADPGSGAAPTRFLTDTL